MLLLHDYVGSTSGTHIHIHAHPHPLGGLAWPGLLLRQLKSHAGRRCALTVGKSGGMRMLACPIHGLQNKVQEWERRLWRRVFN